MQGKLRILLFLLCFGLWSGVDFCLFGVGGWWRCTGFVGYDEPVYAKLFGGSCHIWMLN